MEPGLYKYVRFSNNEIRFTNAMFGNHTDLVKENDKPISAAFLYLQEDSFRIDDHSSSLKLYPLEDDRNLIQEIVKVPYKEFVWY